MQFFFAACLVAAVRAGLGYGAKPQEVSTLPSATPVTRSADMLDGTCGLLRSSLSVWHRQDICRGEMAQGRKRYRTALREDKERPLHHVASRTAGEVHIYTP